MGRLDEAEYDMMNYGVLRSLLETVVQFDTSKLLLFTALLSAYSLVSAELNIIIKFPYCFVNRLYRAIAM